MSSIQITWFYKSADLCLGLTKGRSRSNGVSQESGADQAAVTANAELVSMRRDPKTLQFEPSSFRYENLTVLDLKSEHVLVPTEFKNALKLHLDDGVSAFIEQCDAGADTGNQIKTKRLKSNFTFRLLQKVKELKLKQASASQWLGAINNLKGIRAWEKQWSGIWQWLESMERDSKISKEEVLSHIDFHACELSLHLTWTTDGITPIQFEACDIPLTVRLKRKIGPDGPWTKIRYKNPSLGYRVLETVRPDLYDKIHWWRVADRKNNILESKKAPVFTSPQKAIDFARRSASRTFSLRGNLAPSREWLDFSLAENEYSEYLVALENFPAEFDSEHFNLRNVLIHLRTTVNFNDQARRILLVEELQSDWLQKSENRSLKSKHPGEMRIPVPLAKDWAKVGVMLSVWLAIQSNCDSVAWSNWQMQFGHYGNYARRHGLRNFYDKELPGIVKKVATDFDCSVSNSDVFIDGIESQCVRMENRWVLEDTNGTVLVGPARSKNALLLKAIERNLLNSQKLRVLHISSTLRDVLLKDGISI